eukprot:655562-Amphidinium_carterae.2
MERWSERHLRSVNGSRDGWPNSGARDGVQHGIAEVCSSNTSVPALLGMLRTVEENGFSQCWETARQSFSRTNITIGSMLTKLRVVFNLPERMNAHVAVDILDFG